VTAPDRRAALRASARIALQGTILYGAARFAGAFLAQYGVASVIVQTVIAEWGAGRLGIAWSDPRAKVPTAKEIALRGLRGAGMGLMAAVIVAGVVLATKVAILAPNVPAPIVALVGAVVPAFLAARDELLLRGLVLRVVAGTPAWARLAACGLAEAAAAYGDGALAPPALAAAFFGGVAYGTLWLRDRGAWLAWGAHAAFGWASTSLATGALVDLRATSGTSLGQSWVTAGSVAVVAALAIASTRKRW
jgi:hypothetical protein